MTSSLAVAPHLDRDLAAGVRRARCHGRPRSPPAAAGASGGHQGVGGHAVDAPGHPQALAEPQRLDARGTGARCRSPWRSGASVRLSAISTRKRSARSSSARSARLRLGADERKDGVDAVVEEMRPDARLQRLDARLRDGRREGAGAQVEVGEGDAGREEHEEGHAARRSPGPRSGNMSPKTCVQAQARPSSRAATRGDAPPDSAASAGSAAPGAQQRRGTR